MRSDKCQIEVSVNLVGLTRRRVQRSCAEFSLSPVDGAHCSKLQICLPLKSASTATTIELIATSVSCDLGVKSALWGPNACQRLTI